MKLSFIIIRGMDGAARWPGSPCGRPAPAMTRCECAELPFAEIRRRLGAGRNLEQVQAESGVGLICTACLPDLRAYLAGQPPAGDPAAPAEHEPVDPAA